MPIAGHHFPRSTHLSVFVPRNDRVAFGQSQGSTVVAREKPHNCTPSYLTHTNPARAVFGGYTF